MKTSKLSQIFSSKIFVLLLSLFLALVAWIAVVLTISPEQTRIIYNVPITIPETGTNYQSLGLDIVTQDLSSLTVNVTVVGERNVIGALTRESFTVTPLFTSVESAGEYELALQITKATQTLNYVIKNISPQTVTLSFATVTTKTYKVETQLSNLAAPEGYILYTSTSLPAEVSVTASAEAMEKLARVVARVDKSGELTETSVVSCTLVLLDEAGNELDSSLYKLEHTVADVTIPVYKKGSVDLQVQFINVPEGFDADSIQFTMSETSVQVAAAANVLENMTQKVVGYIDLSTLTFGETYTFPVTLGTGVVNLDNLTEVTVTLPQGDLSTKKLTVSDIRFLNGKDQYTYVLHTSRISGVTVIGPKSELDKITAGSVVAVVDIADLMLDRGENTVPVSFEIPAYSHSWVVGSYTVIVEVRPN